MRIYDAYYWKFMITISTIMTILSFFYAGAIYNIFFNVCLGLFIGGLIFSGISFFLAEMQSNLPGESEIDFDADVDIDVDADVDIDVDADVDFDVDADVDIDVDADVDTDVDADVDNVIETDVESNLSDITPTPIMLLLSASFLIYGVSGILLYYIITEPIKFVIFFATPGIVYLNLKLIDKSWKKIAKSRYYTISSTKNIIGKKGEVVLPVDYRGGIIKIPSHTPMKFEKIHVKPINPESLFNREEIVYICDVKNGFLLVDNNKKLIKRRR